MSPDELTWLGCVGFFVFVLGFAVGVVMADRWPR